MRLRLRSTVGDKISERFLMVGFALLFIISGAGVGWLFSAVVGSFLLGVWLTTLVFGLFWVNFSANFLQRWLVWGTVFLFFMYFSQWLTHR
jgi:hypothetical protein